MSERSMARRALVVIDVQNDFCEGGSLAVPGGADVARRITEFMRGHADAYAAVFATRDHHVDPGGHFSAVPDFQDSWPAHCVAGTPGAAFHDDLDTRLVEDVFSKGASTAAYSGFEGVDDSGRTLKEALVQRGVTAIDVAGIATDYCVRATALDARRLGFAVRVFVDLTAGVGPATTQEALDEIEAAGAELADSDRVTAPQRTALR